MHILFQVLVQIHLIESFMYIPFASLSGFAWFDIAYFMLILLFFSYSNGIWYLIPSDYWAAIFKIFWFYKDFTHGGIWDDHFRTIIAFLVQFCVKAFSREGSFLYIEENGHGPGDLWTCHDCYFLLLKCRFARYDLIFSA